MMSGEERNIETVCARDCACEDEKERERDLEGEKRGKGNKKEEMKGQKKRYSFEVRLCVRERE